jgi:hypothetical protein
MKDSLTGNKKQGRGGRPKLPEDEIFPHIDNKT